MQLYMWRRGALPPGLAGQTCVRMLYQAIFCIFNSWAWVMHITKTLCLYDVSSFGGMMMSLMMSSYACVAGHMTFQYKRSHTWWGGSVTKTFWGSDRLKHVLVATPLVHPCNWSLLSSICIKHVWLCVTYCACPIHELVFQESLGVLHTPHIASVGLLCLSVGARVHYGRKPRQTPNVCRAHHMQYTHWECLSKKLNRLVGRSKAFRAKKDR